MCDVEILYNKELKLSKFAYTADCLHCGAEFSYDIEHMGAQSQCHSCHSTVVLPTAELPAGYNVGAFEVIQLIGEGAMGQVYTANQVSMNRTVALKIIKPEITSNEENITDFIREIQLLASFNHPNIVLAIEAGKQGNLYFLAMEYIQGDSLDDKIMQGEAFSEEESLTYVLKVAQALESAWDEQNLIHCDIKPANVMLDRKDNPKLMDLGISKCSHDQSTSSQIVGTPFFMSPEQACGKTLDFRSDIFSLGASLFNMLTCQYPFPGQNLQDPLAVIEAVKNDPVDTALLKERGISKATAMLILKMCSKDLDERHASWGECIKQIEGSLGKFTDGEKEPVGPPKKQMKVSQAAISRRKQKKKKSFIPILLLAALGYGAYWAYENDFLGTVKEKIEEQQKINAEKEKNSSQQETGSPHEESTEPSEE